MKLEDPRRNEAIGRIEGWLAKQKSPAS
jgi:hypothetical protein